MIRITTHISSTLRFGFSGALLALVATAPVPAADADPQLTDAEANEAIEDIKLLAAEAERILESARSAHLDPDVLLEQSDYDPQKLLEWIRQETTWVPYHGSLRGASGVLMDRLGNSLDRSLLLATLLEEAGFETRLARIPLPGDVAASLLDRQSQRSRVAQPRDRSPETDAVRDTRQEVSRQSKALIELAGLPWTPESGASSAPPENIEAIKDHWWVQAKLGSTWQDLDPMLADPTSPKPDTSKATIHALDALPEDLFHEVTFRLVIERWDEGKTSEEIPLTYSLRPADSPLFPHFDLEFLPYSEDWSAESKNLDEVQVADSARFWRPTLKITGKSVGGEWFSDKGIIEIPATFATAKKLKSASKALGMLGGSSTQKEPESYLTAAWLEYDVYEPVRGKSTTRRELFDLLGLDQRRANGPSRPTIDLESRRNRGLALQRRTSALVLSCTPDPDTVYRAALETWSRNRNFFIAMVYEAAGWEDERVPIALGQGSFRPLDLMAMATLRNHWSRLPGSTYIDRINIFSTHLTSTIQGDSTVDLSATDIVLNHVGVVPGSPDDPRLVRLEQGVLDTLVETTFSDDQSGFNTYLQFSRSSGEAGAWIGLDQGANLDKLLSGLPPSDLERMRIELADGQNVVVSASPSALGDETFASWWRIDARDGTTLGMGYRGWGVDGSGEYPGQIVIPAAIRELGKKHGLTVGCKVAEATIIISTELLADKLHADKILHQALKALKGRPGRRTLSAVCKLK